MIKIARELEELKIFDNKTGSLLLFEAVQHIRKEKPFLSQDDANARLKMILFALENFEI